MQKLKFVSPARVPFSATIVHFLHNKIHQKISGVVSSERYFNQMLVWACRMEGSNFRVPTAYALSSLGPKLDFTISPTTINGIIRACVQADSGIKRVDNWFLGAHDWSSVLVAVEDDAIVREARMLYSADFRFTETEAYATCRRRLEIGDPVSRNIGRLDSIEKIQNYFNNFITLWESMDKHGLLSPGEFSRLARGRVAEKPQRRIGVTVGADGIPYRLPGGQHRFAIALILGCEIPAQLRMIHSDRLKHLLNLEQSRPIELVYNEIRRLGKSPTDIVSAALSCVDGS